ncbi:BglII/BstYI family type II restriction endonuclease [Chloroflexota bacterium]
MKYQVEYIFCSEKPLQKADFFKNDVLVEIQFGNSLTVFRDYYKFHLGLVQSLLSLSVLILWLHC